MKFKLKKREEGSGWLRVIKWYDDHWEIELRRANEVYGRVPNMLRKTVGEDTEFVLTLRYGMYTMTDNNTERVCAPQYFIKKRQHAIIIMDYVVGWMNGVGNFDVEARWCRLGELAGGSPNKDSGLVTLGIKKMAKFIGKTQSEDDLELQPL